MIDQALFTAIRSALVPRFTARSMTVAVKQSNQRVMQGAETSPAIYMFKLSGNRVGHTGRGSVWDGVKMNNAERQVIEAVIQFTTLVTQDQTSLTSTSAHDLARLTASMLQSDQVLTELRAAGIFVQRVTDVRNPYFVDERDEFAASPSFDLTVTYNEEYVDEVGVIQSFESGIHRV